MIIAVEVRSLDFMKMSPFPVQRQLVSRTSLNGKSVNSFLMEQCVRLRRVSPSYTLSTMRKQLAELSVCPACLGTLDLYSREDFPIRDGETACRDCGRRYEIRCGLPVFLLKDDHWSATKTEVEGEMEFVKEMPVSEHIKRNRFESKRTWDFLKTCEIPDSPRVLDVGGSSGIGAYLFHSYSPHVVIVDIVPEFLKIGEVCLAKKVDMDACLAMAEWLPFRDDSFDIVFCRQTLHHCDDPPRAIREMFRVAKTGGQVLILGEPCLPVPPLRRERKPVADNTAGARILEKLPDDRFKYSWLNYRRDLKRVSDRFRIERASGMTASRPTPGGIVFVPQACKRGILGRITNVILPFGMGFRGDVNIRAAKTHPVSRINPPVNFKTVGGDELEIQDVPPQQESEYREVFDKFFSELDW